MNRQPIRATKSVGEASRRRVKEAVQMLREKPIQSTTLERMRVTWEADQQVQDLPQPRQFGEGLYQILDHIALPISSDDLILGRILEEVPDEGGERFFQEILQAWNRRAIPRWMLDGGHECFAWERLMEHGLPGLETIAQTQLDQRAATGASEATLDFLWGAVRVYQAFENYARRYAQAAEEAGLAQVATSCAALADREPRTFAEALQLVWLVGHVFCTMLSQNPTLTFGRMDEYLFPFYERDIADGCLTPALAGDLIEDFYCKNSLVLGRGEHQMSSGTERDTGWHRNLTYDAPQYVMVGGKRRDGSPGELTTLFLERIVPRFENPVIVVRYSKEMPDDAWRLVCDKMRQNSSMLVYNDENIIPAMIHAGIEPEDAITYTMHGCNWPDIPGIQHSMGGPTPVLPHYVLDAILDGEPAASMDEVYARIERIAREEISQSCDRFRQHRLDWDRHAPGSLRLDDCFYDGPIQQGRSWSTGGTKYLTLIAAISSLASAADALAALEDGIFRGGRFSMEELREALREDFERHEPLRQALLHAPKFGQDDERADSHAVRLLDQIHRVIDECSRIGSADEVIVFRCLETDMRHRHIGAQLGATADGRHAGVPTSENTSPTPGAAIRGLTAMLRSVAKLPLNKVNSGALNLRVQTRLVEGEAGLDRLAPLLRTYFDLGGLQAQLSVADTEQLRDAQRHPEQYHDLMVRITGYSAAFVDMCRAAQDEIIRREEMGG